MNIAFGQDTNGDSTVTYTTDVHERHGVRTWRRIRVAAHPTHTPMLRRPVTEYHVLVTEHDADGTYRMLRGGTVSTFKAALSVLGEAFREAITDGFAHKTDMERLPVV